MDKSFPRKSAVWNGAILHGIVNATMSSQSVFYGTLGQWICNQYVLNGADGREGVITFAGGHWYPEAPLVGVFHDVHSNRFSPEEELDLEGIFRGCPAYQRSLAEQGALTYLQIEFQGRVLHRVTTAFWDEGEHLVAAEPWEEVLANGASLINDELISSRDAAFDRFQTSYGMSPEQVRFARSLFERKIARPPALIVLTASEASWLASMSDEPKAMETCCQLFKELGIVVPNLKAKQ